jgi:putative SOS response-associated peptidase YedK
MTTEPNGVVAPLHEQAMPVMLMTSDDIDRWLHGNSVEDALAMQKPAPAGNCLVNGPRDNDATCRRFRLQPRRHVDAIAVKIVAIHN